MAELTKYQIYELLNRPGPLWLRNIDLSEIDLSKADLRGANLGGANLTKTNLSGANLHEADLSAAVLVDANLERANLSLADLTKADFSKALINEANLSEAIMVAAESRTSSPVRIPRNNHTLMHIETEGLFPSGEGAGYAGGIVSAAIDGENCAKAAAVYVNK